ncbi:uncharacterized protein LOC129618738 [Condylostylus longicornis]|uniref:uncharacterized protein LOC129618738 n=1 Tax=Condylostylus longicornis TaxID=2530218 RepID=UPI00244E414F|nr:uncharacterized protein LOC129618738 [Condylostylus longicornis]XP_055389675.1 uncharacterized protein LOC129618738 [Condylostylus longicornis]
MPAGRVAGKAGYSQNYYDGRSYVGINEEIMWVSIGMGITIAILIVIALCYIAREKYEKRRAEREYYVTA